MTGLLVSVAWYLIGCAGFVYWWRKDWDFETAQVPLMLIIGLGGPISWIVGYFIHGDPPTPEAPRVILKKRGERK